jgi:hypothetical protein
MGKQKLLGKWCVGLECVALAFRLILPVLGVALAQNYKSLIF